MKKVRDLEHGMASNQPEFLFLPEGLKQT